MTSDTLTFRNWAGNQQFNPTKLHRPKTMDELRAAVVNARKIKAVGSRHAFNDMAAAEEMISLDAFAPDIAIDPVGRTVACSAGIRYVELARALDEAGWALHNLASLPHITVAGAIATSTHGSGDRFGTLSTAVAALDLVTSDGDVLHTQRGDPEFAGMVVNVGALGVISRVWLDIEPAYEVCQDLFENLAWDVLYARFDEVMSSADSVSLFVDYGQSVNQIWQKRRIDPASPLRREDTFLGALAATSRLHPVGSQSAQFVTEQMGIPGRWWDRLPHVVVAGVTERGDHLQSEYLVPRQHAVAAIQAVRSLAPLIQPHLEISEIRSAAADDLWLSSAFGTDTVGIHFSWKLNLDAVMALLPAVEHALLPLRARPHWAKLFVATAAELEPLYPRMREFRELATRLDPRGAFRNEFPERTIFGSSLHGG